MIHLRPTFARFHQAVTHAQAPDDLSWIDGSPGWDAADRLGIYRHAYRARLVGALRDIFPRVADHLGDRFDPIARAWIEANPPTERSLFHIGAGFPDTLDAPARDLGALDRARRDVFDDPDDPPVSVEALSSVPAAQWPALKPRRVGPSRLLWVRHDVTSAAIPRPFGEAQAVLVWRVRATTDVRQRALSDTEAAVVQALDEGGDLAHIMSRLSDRPTPESLAAVTECFAHAAREGWLALDVGAPS